MQVEINLPTVALPGVVVPLTARVSGIDQNEIEVAWVSSLIGGFATGDRTSYAALPVGEHLIHAEARREGNILARSEDLLLSVRTIESLRRSNVEVVGQIALPRKSSAGIAVAGDVLALARFAGSIITGATAAPDLGGFSLFNVADPSRPLELARRTPGANIRDVAIQGRYVFVADDLGGQGGIYDIRDPARPTRIFHLPDAHALFVGECLLGLGEPLKEAAIPIFDLSGLPGALLPLVTLPGIAHDGSIQNGLVYAALFDGFCIYDLHNPGATETVGCANRGWTHSVVPSVDGSHVFVTDESVIGQLEVWDITRPTDIRKVAEYLGEPGTAHLPFVRGSRLYLAAYERGLEILDVSDPKNPRRQAFFDPIEVPVDRQFTGGYDVVVDERGFIYLADTESGVWILRLPDGLT